MANEEIKNGRRKAGGVCTRSGRPASGENGRNPLSMRLALERLLELPDEENSGSSNLEAVAAALVREARKGSIQAFTTLRDSIGEKPGGKAEPAALAGLAARPPSPLEVMAELASEADAESQADIEDE